MRSSDVAIREITDPQDPAVAGFGRLQRATYFAPETLIPGVFIDVVNPTRMTPHDLERERHAGSDPWQRRRIFEHLGFRQVDIRYEQPVGGPNGGPVTILDLLYCPHTPAETVPTALVVATMQAYWSPWLGKSAKHHAQVLES